MELKDRVGIRIKTLRQHRNLTQERLAELIGRSVDTVSNLERGISLPNFETLERLAEKLNVPIKNFFDFEEQDEEQGEKRTALVATLQDMAHDLSDKDLEIAVRQIEALTGRGKQQF